MYLITSFVPASGISLFVCAGFSYPYYMTKKSKNLYLQDEALTGSQIQRYFFTLKYESGQTCFNCTLDCQNLLSDDRKYFNVDAIELIETRPSTAR